MIRYNLQRVWTQGMLTLPCLQLILGLIFAGQSFAWEYPFSQTDANISRRITLPLGSIDGIACDKYPDVVRYLGIPFAEPAVGNLRFRSPRPYTAKYPVPALQATKYPAPCGSFCAKVGDLIGSDMSSEDCLTLSMWVPLQAALPNAKVPVRVFIHGGHDMDCSASDPFVDGCDYARKTGAIQVNMQYRKGAFGMLAHKSTWKESNTTGTWALQDQQLALRWVQENIEYFGGDPKKVLLNGHSQGGQYVEFHQVAPGSNGLFQSAISQSPPCVRQLTLEQAYNLTSSFLTRVGCSTSSHDPDAELACLREKPWLTLFQQSELLATEEGIAYAMCENEHWNPTFQMVTDGVVMPYHVVDALKAGKFSQVPYMVGYTTNEGNFFVVGLDLENKTFLEMSQIIYPSQTPQLIEELYPHQLYEGHQSPVRAQLGDLWTDVFFKCPILERLVAREKSSFQPSYLYQWDVTPTCPPEWQYLGAYHSVDLMPTLGIVDNINPPDGTCNFTKKEKVIADITLTSWTSMADSGAPKWSDGTVWNAWNETLQNGVFFNVDDTKSTTIDLASRCEMLRKLKIPSLQTKTSRSKNNMKINYNTRPNEVIY